MIAGAAGAPPKSVCTCPDEGVDGIDGPRTFSCHGVQRGFFGPKAGSVRTTSLVFVVASISAGAVIHEGSPDLVSTRSSR